MKETLRTLAAILLWVILAVVAAVGTALLDVIFNG